MIPAASALAPLARTPLFSSSLESWGWRRVAIQSASCCQSHTCIRAVCVPMKNGELVFQLTRREVAGQYRGAMLGILWSFVNPVLILAQYTFFFSVVFKARRPDNVGCTSLR